jgi:hypothetical protein
MGGWTVLMVAKDAQGRVGKQLLEAKGSNQNQAWCQPKEELLTLFRVR